MVWWAQPPLPMPGAFPTAAVMKRLLPLLLPAVALAAGCTQAGNYPSLAPRPVELLSFEEPVRVDPECRGGNGDVR